MWDDILDALERHDSAVLTGYDSNHFPFSVRCVPMLDKATRRIHVQVPDASGIAPGKASLLLHSHDEELWQLVQFLVRGTLVRTGDGFYFVPASTAGSTEPGGAVDSLRLLRGMRKRANAYLRGRGIDRPTVPWNEIQQLQERAEQWREARAKERSQ